MKRRRAMMFVSGGIVLVVLVAASFWWWNTRATLVLVPDDLPLGFPAEGFSHQSFEDPLAEHVRDGRVDYEQWQRDAAARASLDRYLAAIARYSPDSAPERFPSEPDRLAYWMYAYNAFVIKAVLDRWPLESVTDVTAPVELVKGLGFFYTLEVVAGGERFTLYRIEHDKVLRAARDPRVHFVLNCASASCPVLRPKLPTGALLEPYLAEAARDFVSDPRNVSVDHERRRIELSAIFDWYQDDFVAEVRRRGLPSARGIVAYLVLVAPDGLKSDLERTEGYTLAYRPYDWSINRASPEPAASEAQR